MQRIFLGSLCFFLLAVKGWAEPVRWVEIRSTHFTVLSNSTEKDARHVAGQLERMRTVFGTVVPASKDDGAAPILVFALRDRKSFQALEPEAYLAKHQLDLAGLFLRGQDGSTILLRLDAEGEHPFATVYHEYTHYMLRKADWWLPLWLNEGLAEFYQNTEITDKDVHLGQPSPDDILYLRQSRLLPLKTLLTVDHNSPYYHDEDKGSVFYAESWALTHYLEINDMQHHTSLVVDYAKYLIAHEDPMTAAQHAFGDLNKLQDALDHYVSQSNFLQLTMKTGAKENEASYQAVPITAADADAYRAQVLVDVNRLTDADALLQTVLASDPKDAPAHASMGYLKMRQGDLEASKKWYGEAAQLDPTDAMAAFQYAQMCLRTNDHQHDTEVEADLKNVIKLMPNDPRAYDALANYYASRHENLAEAHAMSVQAVSLDPGNLAYRVNAANVLAADQQMDNAINVLKAAKAYAHSPDEMSMIDDRISSMESFQAMVERNKANNEAAKKEAEAQPSRNSGGGDLKVITTAQDEPQEHVYPAGPPNGAKHLVSGVIRDVSCTYPTVLTLNLEQAGKKIPLYTNNYFKVEFRTANFVPKDAISPCKDIEGMKAKVRYAEVSSDPTVVGQMVSIELSK
jgi:cytochrome c-type biogenesis protein CcmH/NrfG